MSETSVRVYEKTEQETETETRMLSETKIITTETETKHEIEEETHKHITDASQSSLIENNEFVINTVVTENTIKTENHVGTSTPLASTTTDTDPTPHDEKESEDNKKPKQQDNKADHSIKKMYMETEKPHIEEDSQDKSIETDKATQNPPENERIISITVEDDIKEPPTTSTDPPTPNPTEITTSTEAEKDKSATATLNTPEPQEEIVKDDDSEHSKNKTSPSSPPESTFKPLKNKVSKKSQDKGGSGINKIASQIRDATKVVETFKSTTEGRDKLPKSKSTSPKEAKEPTTNNKVAAVKPKAYRDPRKPSIYPHRMTKTTIARQALAREKRRMYVEERIQSYMRDSRTSQQLLKACGSPYRSISSGQLYSDQTTGHCETREMLKELEKVESASHRSSSLNRSKPLKMSHLQSLPEINTLNHHLGGSSSGYHSSELHHQRHFEPPETLSAISIHRQPPYTYSQSGSFARTETSTAGISQSHSDLRSHQNTNVETDSRNSGIYVDSNPEVTSNFWKNVSEQGFFYSFRVRQSGTVQMIDRAVQTGDIPQSYILDFARQANGTYYLKSSKPLPETSSFMHLPPINSKFGQTPVHHK
jgi:hypothetical protein